MLGCIGYHIGCFRRGETVAFETENIRHIGIVISGCVDRSMYKHMMALAAEQKARKSSM